VLISKSLDTDHTHGFSVAGCADYRLHPAHEAVLPPFTRYQPTRIRFRPQRAADLASVWRRRIDV